MSFSKHLQETFKKEFQGKEDKNYDYYLLYRERLIGFRKEKETVVRVEKPTNVVRARKLGYKAKQGFVVARVRVRKGSGMHKRPIKGRRPKRMGVKKLTRRHSIQSMAEKKASSKFTNCEALNSYKVGEDGRHHYYEVILADISHPSIKNDKKLKWLASGKQKGRAERGLTSAAKKSRGMRRKGTGAEKVRPSVRAKQRMSK